eukprot:6549726-Prymnesium_polylepis.1
MVEPIVSARKSATSVPAVLGSHLPEGCVAPGWRCNRYPNGQKKRFHSSGCIPSTAGQNGILREATADQRQGQIFSPAAGSSTAAPGPPQTCPHGE